MIFKIKYNSFVKHSTQHTAVHKSIKSKLYSLSHKISYSDVIRNQIVFVSSIKLTGVNTRYTYIFVHIGMYVLKRMVH